MIETFSTKFATRRWPVVLFCNLIDIAALNAFVLFGKLKVDGTDGEIRRLFIKSHSHKSLSKDWEKVFVKSYRSSDDLLQLILV